MGVKDSLNRVLGREYPTRLFRNLRRKGKVASLMYHEVLPDSSPVPAWTVVRESDFLMQMEYLKKHFKVVSVDEAMDIKHASKKYNDCFALVTFDDGYRGNRYSALPILESLELPAVFYFATQAIQTGELYWYDKVILACVFTELNELSSDRPQTYKLSRAYNSQEQVWNVIQSLLTDFKKLEPEERESKVDLLLSQSGIDLELVGNSMGPMTPNDVSTMNKSSYVTIGGHSHCHNLLTQLSEVEVRESIETSTELLESWIDNKVSHFAYPNGNYSDVVIRVLETIGYKSAVTTEHGVWEKSDSDFVLPRISVGRFDSLYSFKARVSGISDPWMR